MFSYFSFSLSSYGSHCKCSGDLPGFKTQMIFKMPIFSVIERWDIFFFFFSSSSKHGVINMFLPDRISRALLSTQSSILESSFLFGWGSISSPAKRCSCVSSCLSCASAGTWRWPTGILKALITVEAGGRGESATAGQKWKGRM